MLQRSLPTSSFDRRVLQVLTRKSEAKYVDYGWSAVAINDPNLSTSNNIYCINPMQEGSGYFNRIGRKTKTLSIRLKFHFVYKYSNDLTSGYSAGTVGNMLRMVLVYDRENTGVIPEFNKMFGVTDNQGNSTTYLTAPLHMTRTDRFRVLLDEMIVFNPTSTPVVGDYDPITGNTTAAYTCYNTKTVDRWVDCSKKDILQTYQSTSNPATVSDLSSGAIYLVLKPADFNDAVNKLSIATGLARTKVSDL